MIDINTTNGYFIHLCACALNGKQPIEKPDEVSFADVYSLARKQKMLSTIWCAVEKLNNKPESELEQKWKRNYNAYLKQTVFQDIEIESLIELFVSNGYSVMPLKGSQIRSLYPEPEMRAMGDIDFLVKTDGTHLAREKVKDLMLSDGYTVELLDDGQVDSYRKPNYICTEIHFEFMAKSHRFYDYFIVDWDKLVPGERKNVYSMALEDLYYFNIGHFAKNMTGKGNGIRSVMDTYVMWEAMSDKQKEIVASRLDIAGLKVLNDKLIKIAYIWFGGAVDDGSVDAVQNYFFSNSAYGFESNLATLNVMKSSSKGVKNAKIKRIVKRIFPDADELYSRFTIKHRCFVILPFLWLIRIIMLPFSSKQKLNNIQNEIKKSNHVTDENINNLRFVYESLGLDYKSF